MRKVGALDIVSILAFVVAYFFAHLIAFFFPDAENILMAVWPAGGIGLAAFLLTPRNLWLWMVAGFYIAGVSASVLVAHRPISISVGFMMANMAESVLCALLIQKWCGQMVRFDRVKAILALLSASVFVNALTACIGAGTAVIFKGSRFFDSWFSWFVSDGLGVFLVTPVIVSWVLPARAARNHVSSSRRYIEASLCCLILGISVWLVFSPGIKAPPTWHLHPYMLMLFMAWPAFRLGMRVLSVSLILVAILTIGNQPLYGAFSPFMFHTNTVSIVDLQIFLAFTSVTALLLYASHAEAVNANTDRRRSARELLESQNRLELAATSAQLGIWDWDIVDNKMLWNDRMFRLYGIKERPENYGVEIWKNGLHPDDIGMAWEACQAALRGEKEYNIEFRVRHPDGSIRIIKADGMVLRDSSGRPVRMLGINHDITDQKNAEGERLKYEQQLQQSLKLESLGVLAGGIAHDFNNLLSAMA